MPDSLSHFFWDSCFFFIVNSEMRSFFFSKLVYRNLLRGNSTSALCIIQRYVMEECSSFLFCRTYFFLLLQQSGCPQCSESSRVTSHDCLTSSESGCSAMGGRSAPTVYPIRTSKPSWRCRSPGTPFWTAAPDMDSHSPQTHPCWSGMSLRVRKLTAFWWKIFVRVCCVLRRTRVKKVFAAKGQI